MNFRSAGLGACLLAVMIAGCGTVSASAPGGGGHPTASAEHTQAPGTSTAGAGVASSCQRPADDTLTLASNGRNYCVRIGEHLDVYLRGSLSRPWLMPLASSDVLVPVPNGGMSLPAGLIGESFAEARLGNRRLAVVDGVHLALVRVHADHGHAARRHASCQRRAQFSQADDAGGLRSQLISHFISHFSLR